LIKNKEPLAFTNKKKKQKQKQNKNKKDEAFSRFTSRKKAFLAARFLFSDLKIIGNSLSFVDR